MCYWRKSRANRHVLALLKAVEKSRWERVEYDVAPIRHRARLPTPNSDDQDDTDT